MLGLLVGLCFDAFMNCPEGATCHPLKDPRADPLPPGVVGILLLIVKTIERSVWGYFITFISCWMAVLGAMTVMIKAYVAYLADLTVRLTTWPNNLLFVVGVAVALLGAALVLRVIGTSILHHTTARLPVGVPLERGAFFGENKTKKKMKGSVATKKSAEQTV